MSLADYVRAMLDDYGLGQDLAAEIIMDDAPGSGLGIAGYTAGGVILAHNHHVIPRFLLGIDNPANLYPGLPVAEHRRIHELIEEEFRRAGLDPPNSQGAKNWRRRLRDNDVKPPEVARVRSALLSAAQKFDIETRHAYGLARRTASALNADYARGVFGVIRRLR